MFEGGIPSLKIAMHVPPMPGDPTLNRGFSFMQQYSGNMNVVFA